MSHTIVVEHDRKPPVPGHVHVTCPRCDGEGVTDDIPSHGVEPLVSGRCPECHGLGSVPARTVSAAYAAAMLGRL